ncbi:hypothetical protein SV7mr_17170 [Stieleria bergensis]|uniref:Uncharacterized protein n=1 Tax=Stieleria bergensis TaxID=2528025 RepID=A0A517SSW8_9BACT|nr:hypothetical protein SV7mr_17170 [Planctomycetes bacterium SV_7m_r]
MQYKIESNPQGKSFVKYRCPRCKCILNSPLADAGKQDKCPDCTQIFVVPGAAELAAMQKQQQKPEVNIQTGTSPAATQPGVSAKAVQIQTPDAKNRPAKPKPAANQPAPQPGSVFASETPAAGMPQQAANPYAIQERPQSSSLSPGEEEEEQAPDAGKEFLSFLWPVSFFNRRLRCYHNGRFPVISAYIRLISRLAIVIWVLGLILFGCVFLIGSGLFIWGVVSAPSSAISASFAMLLPLLWLVVSFVSFNLWVILILVGAEGLKVLLTIEQNTRR